MQLRWFERELRAAREDPRVRWLIVTMHHPCYSSCKGRLNDEGLIRSIRKPLDDYKVDLVLVGHNHHYERSFPLRGDAPASRSPNRYRKGEGVVFVTSGGGGISLYDFVRETPPRTAIREKTYEYLRVHVPARGPLVVEAIRTEDGSLLDRFEIAEK